MRMLAQPGTPQAGPPKMPGVINPMYSQAPQQQPAQQSQPPKMYQQAQVTQPAIRQALTQPVAGQAPSPWQGYQQNPQQQPGTPMPAQRDPAAEQAKKRADHAAWVASRGDGYQNMTPDQAAQRISQQTQDWQNQQQWNPTEARKGTFGSGPQIDPRLRQAATPGAMDAVAQAKAREQAIRNNWNSADPNAWQQELAAQQPAVTPNSIRTALTSPTGGEMPVLKAPEGSPSQQGFPKSRQQEIFERRMAVRNQDHSEGQRALDRQAHLDKFRRDNAARKAAAVDQNENTDWMKSRMGWAPTTEAEAKRYRDGYTKQDEQRKAMQAGDYSGASSQAGWYQTKPGVTQYMPEGLAGHVRNKKKPQGGGDFLQSLMQGLMR